MTFFFDLMRDRALGSLPVVKIRSIQAILGYPSLCSLRSLTFTPPPGRGALLTKFFQEAVLVNEMAQYSGLKINFIRCRSVSALLMA